MMNSAHRLKTRSVWPSLWGLYRSSYLYSCPANWAWPRCWRNLIQQLSTVVLDQTRYWHGLDSSPACSE